MAKSSNGWRTSQTKNISPVREEIDTTASRYLCRHRPKLRLPLEGNLGSAIGGVGREWTFAPEAALRQCPLRRWLTDCLVSLLILNDLCCFWLRVTLSLRGRSPER
jgi:hypothetical protein